MAGKIPQGLDPAVARSLVLDELFDLTLYQELRNISSGGLRDVLDQLVPIEIKHYQFWNEFFGLDIAALDLRRRIKLRLILRLCRAFNPTAAHLALEAIEIYGVRKYLSLWDAHEATPFGQALREILRDEFQHEDAVVSQMAERKISPERIRSIFLGLNDGLVEILGAITGFFAAFGKPSAILAASVTTAVAGAFSMAAGAYVAGSSEREMRRIEAGKESFLNGRRPKPAEEPRPLFSAVLVGASYFAGAVIPILPVAFGAKTVLAPIIASSVLFSLVSVILAALSGMDVKRRLLTNLGILSVAVAVTYAIGLAAKAFWGIPL